jgi:hypothetical protein
MCMGAKDKSAQIARDAETKRQANINAGMGRIDETFKPFNDDYFAKQGQSYNDYYLPQVEDQYQDARKKLTFSLARTGGLNSTSGAEQLGKLGEEYTKQRGLIGEQALAEQQRQRGVMEGNRSNVVNQLYSSANPEAAAAAASANATQLTAPPAYSALGDLFGKFAATGADYINSAKKGYTNAASPMFGPASGDGSQKVVR